MTDVKWAIMVTNVKNNAIVAAIKYSAVKILAVVYIVDRVTTVHVQPSAIQIVQIIVYKHIHGVLHVR